MLACYITQVNYNTNSNMIISVIAGTQLDDYRVRNQSLLIGGEACLWAEYVDDDGFMPRLW